MDNPKEPNPINRLTQCDPFLSLHVPYLGQNLAN